MPAQQDSTTDRRARRDPGRPWVTAAVLLTAAVSLALMFLPLISTADSAGSNRESLVEQEGWAVAAGLAVPVLISAVPLLVPSRLRRWMTVGAGVLLGAGALVSIASVGLFYLPSAALLVVAAIRTWKQR